MFRKIIAFFSLIIILSGCSTITQSDTDFSSPEKTLTYFIESLQNNDFDKALIAFSTEETPYLMDYVGYLTSYKYLEYDTEPFYPSSYTSINRYSIIQNALKFYKNIIVGLSKEDLNTLYTDIVVFSETELIPQLEDALLDIDYSKIEIAKIEKSPYHNEEAQEKVKKSMGADDAAFYHLVLGLGDKEIDLIVVMLKYKDEWKIENGLVM